MSHGSDKDYEAQLEGGAPIIHTLTAGGHTLDTSQPAFPTYHRKIANPGPLGLGAFSTTTFLLSLINLSAAGVKTPNVILGMALFYGGFVQMIAGQWEFVVGNTFGATVFTSYGAFWISYGFIISPWSGIAAAYGTNEVEFGRAIGFFLTSWLILTIIIFFASLRSSVSLASTVGFLVIALCFLVAGAFVPSKPVLTQIGGGVGIVVAICGWYTMAVGLLTPETSLFVLPAGSLTKKE
ncbi:hypothetical protein RQP46_007622 [Phenoliferia psychrophenolica]